MISVQKHCHCYSYENGPLLVVSVAVNGTLHSEIFEVILVTLETFSTRFLVDYRKPQMSRSHVTLALPSCLPSAVHVSTARTAVSGK